MIQMDKTLLQVMNECVNFKSYQKDFKYHFQSEITLREADVQIVIWCEQLAHQLDLLIHVPTGEANTHGCDCSYEIDFYHNGDVWLYTMSDTRMDMIPMCIQKEIDVIIEMNE